MKYAALLLAGAVTATTAPTTTTTHHDTDYRDGVNWNRNSEDPSSDHWNYHSEHTFAGLGHAGADAKYVPYYNILSINGGGIKGWIPANIISRIEALAYTQANKYWALTGTND